MYWLNGKENENLAKQALRLAKACEEYVLIKDGSTQIEQSYECVNAKDFKITINNLASKETLTNESDLTNKQKLTLIVEELKSRLEYKLQECVKNVELETVGSLILNCIYLECTLYIREQEDSNFLFKDYIYYPSRFQDTTNYLRLKNWGFKKVESNAFRSLIKTKIIDLSENKLEEIEADAFLTPAQIETLFLNNNEIKKLHPNAFRLLNVLKTLDLSRNRISNLDVHLFRDLSNLENLILYDNCIESIDLHILSYTPELSYICLNGNKISELNPNTFMGLSKMKKLLLNRNKLRNIHSNLFRSLTNLDTLELESNEIVEIFPNAFKKHTGLLYLSLGNNKLIRIDSKLFNGLINLVYLDLSQNRIKVITFDSFHDLRNLKQLRLEKNQLVELEPNLFQNLSKLTELNLSHNKLVRVSPHLFSSLSNLEILDLSFNDIKYLGDDFESELDLSNNKADWNRFIGLTKLKELFLNDNKLSRIPLNFFSTLSNLMALDLGSNEIKHISFFEENMECLRYLNLSNNKIEEINSNSLIGLSRLYYLNLSSNVISKIEVSAFDELININKFYLHNNKLTDLSSNLFKFRIFKSETCREEILTIFNNNFKRQLFSYVRYNLFMFSHSRNMIQLIELNKDKYVNNWNEFLVQLDSNNRSA